MNATRNRRDVLDDLVSRKALTSDGKDWLISALDPFHDYNHQIAGYPDADSSQTVVSCFQYAAEISCPVGHVGTWDAHVYSLPLASTSSYVIAVENSDWTAATVDKAKQFFQGPLNISAGPAGSELIPSSSSQVDKTHACIPSAGCDDLCQGNSRIVGMGFEIVNTTSEMYKQGSLTAYRMPQNPTAHIESLCSLTESLSVGAPCQRIQGVPAILSEATMLKGTRTWDAKEGAYATMFQSSITNPLSTLTNKMIVVGEPAPVTPSSDALVSPYAINALFGPSQAIPALQKITCFDTTGVFLTGLSNQSTFSVRLKVYVERAPGFTDTTLAPLASPSAGYDINALQLYSQVISTLPCAVMVRDNGLGDWWRTVLKFVKAAAGPIGNILGTFVPGATLVGNAVQQVAGSLNDATNAVTRKTKVEQLPRPMYASERTKKKVFPSKPKLVKLGRK